MLELNNIYNMDCIEGMKLIDDNSIDLVVTDPPYLINYQSAMRTDKFEKVEGDKGTKADYNLITSSLNELYRVLKEGSHIYIFCSWHNIDFFKQEFEKHFELKNILVWKKKGGFIGDLETQYGVDYEFILYGFKKWYIESIKDEYENYRPIKDYLKKEKRKSKLSNKQISLMFSKYTNKEGCLNRSVCEHYFSNKQWFFPTKDTYENILQPTGFWQKPFEELEKEYNELKIIYDKRKHLNGKRISGIIETSKVTNNKYIHPTQKPTQIFKILIEKSSNENDIILDCFMGSGTTKIVCMNTNRNYIGFELDENYCNIANQRIS